MDTQFFNKEADAFWNAKDVALPAPFFAVPTPYTQHESIQNVAEAIAKLRLQTTEATETKTARPKDTPVVRQGSVFSDGLSSHSTPDSTPPIPRKLYGFGNMHQKPSALSPDSNIRAPKSVILPELGIRVDAEEALRNPLKYVEERLTEKDRRALSKKIREDMLTGGGAGPKQIGGENPTLVRYLRENKAKNANHNKRKRVSNPRMEHPSKSNNKTRGVGAVATNSSIAPANKWTVGGMPTPYDQNPMGRAFANCSTQRTHLNMGNNNTAMMGYDIPSTSQCMDMQMALYFAYAACFQEMYGSAFGLPPFGQ